MTAWRRPFLIILVSVIVVEVAMIALDMGPETLLVAAAGAFVGTSIWCARSLSVAAPPPRPAPRAFAPPRAAGADNRVKRLRTGILFGRSMGGYAERLRTTLIELIDDQLAHAHGVDRAAEPDVAAEILGPVLTDFVSRPEAAASMADTRELTRIVTLIERI